MENNTESSTGLTSQKNSSPQNNLGLPHYKSTIENSLGWRVWHGTNYLLGGLFFVLGSLAYFPAISAKINGDLVGGILFTIGSTNFLIADLTEWNHYKLGCIGQSYSDSEKVEQGCCAKFRRVEVGLNFFCSAMGSLLYLLGSIFFIPSTNLLTSGELLFIIGSLVIFASQLWKCIRTSISDENDPNDRSIKCSNITADFPGFMIDVWAGIGGLIYAIGTYIFSLAETNAEIISSASWFVSGGSSFFISGLFMQYRYYCVK